MTAEEMKASARKEKEVIVRIMINCYPLKFGDPYKAREELMTKTLKQLKKMYEEIMKEKWIYDHESPWMR